MTIPEPAIDGEDTVSDFYVDLRRELRHRLRPLTGVIPGGSSRPVSPLELLYDLTYVVAFGKAAEELAATVAAGHVAAGVGALVFAVFAVGWAWLNFSWYASAYGNDDALFRVATIIQMVGVIVLTFGLPQSFEDAAAGANPNNLMVAVGYLVMRAPLVLLWLRAARHDRRHRRTALAYAAAIGGAQLVWLLAAIVPMSGVLAVLVLVLLVAVEMGVRIVIENRLGWPPWDATHLAERFSLLALITLGEVVAATTEAVGALVQNGGWSVGAAAIAAAGIVLVAGLWWGYYLVPSRLILARWPERIFVWRYAHLPMYGAIAAVGGGLRLAAAAVEGGQVTLLQVTIALVAPVGLVIALIFLLWSTLVHAYDLSHIPLLAAALLPLAAAVVVAVVTGPTAPLGPDDGPGRDALIVIIALVAFSTIVEVVGHELIGYTHTVRALRRRELAERAANAIRDT
ncbi:low temperature requirement protein A [Arthrobacter sp. M4]|uniref:low temperature requirement protein A n=1 Tax=Arthrobacter sp. M4 TaxID=218160 RepID=UPI001CDBE156|nr:low temperature requirement protein A [Arthrobacter sp. M4]MCA4131785.1 low temperature requirement protein A [Arthrobacter sp. M4]